MKQKVHLYEGPLMSEDMQNTIRNFIIKEKEDKGSFPDIPDEEEGGSRICSWFFSLTDCASGS